MLDRFTVRPSSDDVFYLEGELDLAFTDLLESAVQVGSDGDAPVVLDLSGLTFVDSTGIRTFVRLADRIRPRPLLLRAPRSNVATVFDIIRIDTLGVHVEDGDGSPSDGASDRDGSDDGPGAWSRRVATRATNRLLRLRSRQLCAGSRFLRMTSIDLRRHARSLRHESMLAHAAR
jgi:anti-anti-sigma factor